MQKFLVILFCCFTSQFAHAKFDWNLNCKNAYKSTVQLKFEEANYWLNLEKEENPNNNLVHLIDNYSDYLIIQIGEEPSDYKKLKANKDIRIEFIENDKSSSPWKLYSEAEIHLQWATNRIKFGEYFTAAFEINKAYRLLKENEKLYPNFTPTKKSLGVLYAIIGSVPEKYNWILSTIGMEGGIQKGLTLIKNTILEMKSSHSFSYMVEETYFLYAFLKMNLENEPNDLKIILKEIKNSEYILLKFASNRLATKLYQNDLALDILEKRNKSAAYYNFHYLDYLLSICKQNKLDFSSSILLKKYVNEFNGFNYKKSALLRLSWNYLLQNDITNFKLYRDRINKVGDIRIGADKEAQFHFENEIQPHPCLIRARLLFDGGYFNKAIEELNTYRSHNTINNNIYDELSYNYRYARTLEKLNDIDSAIVFYKKTIEKGNKNNLFFSAKSALQLGLIYENRNDIKNAKLYFKKCIEMDNHLYEQSLEQKAKTALERIGD
ncbi:MAG: tetratricopeptide repeat protein [Flavobacteriales bacterium]